MYRHSLPSNKSGRKRAGGVCTQTKIRKLNRQSDDFNWAEDVYIIIVFSPQSQKLKIFLIYFLLFPGIKDF